MLPPADPFDQGVDGHRAGLGDLGLGRSAPAHGHDHRVQAGLLGHTGGLPGDGRLAGPLSRADHRDGRHRQGLRPHGRIEPEVRAEIWHAAGQRYGDQLHPLSVPQHGLVGQVEHGLRPHVVERPLERPVPLEGGLRDDRRQAQVRRAVGGDLLRAADEQGRERFVAHAPRGLDAPARDRRVVLAVHQDQHSHLWKSPFGRWFRPG
jgi:hypothetical protein